MSRRITNPITRGLLHATCELFRGQIIRTIRDRDGRDVQVIVDLCEAARITILDYLTADGNLDLLREEIGRSRRQLPREMVAAWVEEFSKELDDRPEEDTLTLAQILVLLVETLRADPALSDEDIDRWALRIEMEEAAKAQG